MANGDNPNLAYAPRGGELGAATAFDRGEYQVSSLSYPSDIMSEQYGGNYVIFYINVHEDSKLYKNSKENFVSGEIPPQMRGDLAGAKYSDTTMHGAAMVAGAGAAQTANLAGNTAKLAGANMSKGAETVANLTAGALGTEALVQALGQVNAQYKRMKQAICLHIPTDLSIRYSANWETEGLAGTEAAMSAAENLVRGNLKNSVGAGASYLAGIATKTPGVGQMMSKTTGTAANPKKEQLFDQVDFRTFTFSYQFFPRSSEEARNVREIIKAFKLHMHPEYRDANHFLWIYPSEFDIYYYNNFKENMNLHRHTSCVLTDLNVSYSPQGTFTTFADGMPTQINVQMTFKELALLSKETIQDGF